jgi:hypothetical protein
MSGLPYLAIGNKIDVVIEDLHTAASPDTPITDATITWTLYDSSDQVVAGCNAVSMAHTGSGTYRGGATPSSALTEAAQYRLAIACSNYDVSWSQRYQAKYRAFAD